MYEQNVVAQGHPARPAKTEGASSSEREDGEVPEEADADVLGLVPPHDLETEGTILSHCLEHGPFAGLAAKHFYSHANQYVYEAICSVAQPPDIVEVKRELRKSMPVDGAHYLGILVAQPVTAYPERHAETIKELYRRRLLSDALLKVRVELRTGDVSAAEAWRRVKEVCEEMAGE